MATKSWILYSSRLPLAMIRVSGSPPSSRIRRTLRACSARLPLSNRTALTVMPFFFRTAPKATTLRVAASVSYVSTSSTTFSGCTVAKCSKAVVSSAWA
jgi:hypothetical protein